jgi:hypothetical protein
MATRNRFGYSFYPNDLYYGNYNPNPYYNPYYNAYTHYQPNYSNNPLNNANAGQRCQTPRNEPGRCMFVQACPLKQVISDYYTFLEYSCFIG